MPLAFFSSMGCKDFILRSICHHLLFGGRGWAHDNVLGRFLSQYKWIWLLLDDSQVFRLSDFMLNGGILVYTHR